MQELTRDSVREKKKTASPLGFSPIFNLLPFCAPMSIARHRRECFTETIPTKTSSTTIY